MDKGIPHLIQGDPSSDRWEKRPLSFEEALEEITGQRTYIEGRGTGTRIGNRNAIISGTEDAGAIPDPSFMLPPKRVPPKSILLEMLERRSKGTPI